MVVLIVALLLICAFMFAIFAMVAGVALFAGLFLLGLIVIQVVLGKILTAVTGKPQRWLMSKKTFLIEGVIAAVVVVVYFNLPVDSGDLIPDKYASVSYSTSQEDDGGDQTIDHGDQLETLTRLLEGHRLRRRLNLRFINEAEVMHDYSGVFLYFRDENGDLIKKIRLYGDLFGVAKKEDKDFVYYRLSQGVFDELAFETVFYLEQREKVYDVYEEELTALRQSLDYADGVVSFTIPEWGTEDWSLSINGRLAVLDENGEKVDTDYIMYLEDRCEANDWAPNERVSFSLQEAPHEKLSYTVEVEGYKFETLIRLSGIAEIDEQYVYPEHEG